MKRRKRRESVRRGGVGKRGEVGREERGGGGREETWREREEKCAGCEERNGERRRPGEGKRVGGKRG